MRSQSLVWAALGVMLLGGAMIVASTGVVLDASATGAPDRVADPGLRGGQAGAGGPIAGLTTSELTFFGKSAETFAEVDSVDGTIANESGSGLGPRFNMNSCAGCHAQPAFGGSSPLTNPQLAVAKLDGATNKIPSFITSAGPVREARFVHKPDGSPDGGVHDLFTITGRSDSRGCKIAQPDFAYAAQQDNLIFRIPTPVFGAGLIEAIPDKVILANETSNVKQKRALGISGHENREGNAGTITRFGWKAQNKSLLLFGAEAYNVEMGVSNEIFQTERDETTGCTYNGIPEDHTNFDAASGPDTLSDINKFAIFMRFLAPPTPAAANSSTAAGRAQMQSVNAGKAVFQQTGCALCHTPSLETGLSSTTALSNKTANLYSDLLVHDMGSGLADNIVQGAAQGDEFRTAPLWGLGQRAFFLHDGRTSDLVQAIKAHASPGSEANAVVANFSRLSEDQKENLLQFLRSL